MNILNEISQYLQQGRAKNVKELVAQAVDAGIDTKEILENGLLAGMSIIGEKFKVNEVFVPDVLIAARAMNAGVEILKPLLAAGGVKAKGKVVLGTVKGDLHDIGKNLVKMMMEGKGLEVIDLGVDVPAEKFVSEAKDNGAQIIACSALLTTTMSAMKDVISIAKQEGIRDSLTIMIGGAPITESYRAKIGADIYSPDSSTAAEDAVSVFGA